MILCNCFFIEEQKVKDFLSKNPSEEEWKEFISINRISEDCGACLSDLNKLKEFHEKTIDNDLEV